MSDSKNNSQGGFLWTNDISRTPGVDEDGTKIVIEKEVPRDIRKLTDKQWDKPEYVSEALRPVIMGAVRSFSTKKGDVLVRDVFLAGVQGGPAPRGGLYPRQLVGSLFQGVNKDRETGEETLWTRFENLLEREERRQKYAKSNSKSGSGTTEAATDAEAPVTAEEAKAVAEEVAAV